MPQRTLEERVAALEKQLSQLLGNSRAGKPTKDWRRTIGMFTEDEGVKLLFKEALRLREKDRQRARRRQLKTRIAKR